MHLWSRTNGSHCLKGKAKTLGRLLISKYLYVAMTLDQE